LFNEECIKQTTIYEDLYDDENFDLNLPIDMNIEIGKDSLIYIPSYSPNEYKIKILDVQNNIKRVITKSYRQIPISKKTIDNYLKYYTEVTGNYKNSILDHKLDKYDRLFVTPALEVDSLEGKFVDVFEGGVFINRIEMPVNPQNYDFFVFKNDKLLIYRNNESKLEVYDY